MFEISTELRFSSAHKLNNYDGPCENIHGHNWIVKAYVRCSTLDSIGLGIDFKELRKELKKVIGKLDHRDLNVIFDPFGKNPSSENIAQYIYEELSKTVNGTNRHIAKIDVFETPGNCASYFKND